ncbi:MAG: hypothetical protein EOP10_15280 [Proteobacteria bacterium]|nr:MAG: hypothetical protein EOP10_15280 [Pseudomonadota bacterium]
MPRLNVFVRLSMLLFYLLQDIGFANAHNTTFRIEGRELKSANGEVFIPRGFNVGLDFWNHASDYMGDFAVTGANIIRLNVYSYAVDANLIRRFLEAADGHKLVVMVEVHDVMGSNEGSDLLNLVNSFWLNPAIKQVMLDHQHHTLVNIANEWKGTWEDDAGWRESYTQAIRALRDSGYPHVLVIDAPGYGQHHHAIAKEGPNLLAVDPNLLFSVHLYSVFSQSTAIYEMMQSLDRFPLIIGEFGWEHGSSEHLAVDEDAIMQEAAARGRGWMAWSYTGNGPNDHNLDMFENRNLTNRQARTPFGGRVLWWGNRVIHGPHGLQATSVVANIYGLEDNHYYEFRPSSSPTQCLDVAAGSLFSGARVQQWPCNNLAPQKFRAIHRDSGWFALQNALSGKCLVGADQGMGIIGLTQEDCSLSDSQSYRAVNVGWGYLKLLNRQNNLVLDLAGINPQEPGTQAGQFWYAGDADQRWLIVPTH